MLNVRYDLPNIYFMNDFLKMLQWRGMLHEITPGLDEALSKKKLTGYIGYDPTAASLHVGNLATLMLLTHFQKAGHRPIALIGGATGMIGDPSFKTLERSFLSEEVIRHNQACIGNQLAQFLDFETTDNKAKVLNNIDWFGDMGFLTFLREVGKYIPVNYMMAKDAVKRRLETGISFTEFSYTLLQAYDFYHLYIHHDVDLQMGGADQWGNLTTGIELIRKKASKEVFALTTPLITKSDGTKFGKTEQGNIWLDPNMTTPYDFYQFWLNSSDADVIKYIKIFTFLPKEEIMMYIAQHQEAPHQRLLQKLLAKIVTTYVHSDTVCKQVEKTATLLFGHATAADLHQFEESYFHFLARNIPQVTVSQAEIKEMETIVDLIAYTGKVTMLDSKGAVRRAIQEGGIYINKVRITDANQSITLLKPLHQQYLLVQKGKKHHYLIRFAK